jgi:ligand-binding sensor domain-containing protein
MEDKKGNTWIGTFQGISCYDPATNQFTNYENDPGNKQSPKK